MFGIKTAIINKVDELKQESNLKEVRIFPMGYICNHACPMCWRENLSPAIRQHLTKAAFTIDLQLDDYINLIKTLPPTVKRISICGGGEPTLFKGIKTIMATIKKQNLYGHIITNGSTLTPEFIDLLISIGWDSMHISVNAATRSVYKIINGVDHYDLVLNNIKNMQKHKGKRSLPELRFSFVIQKGNYEEIIPFAKLAASYKAADIYYNPLIPFDLTLKTPSPFALDLKEKLLTLKYLKEAEELMKKSPTRTNVNYVLPIYQHHPNYNLENPDQSYWATKYCDRVLQTIDIMSSGKVLPCGFGFELREDFDLKMNVKKGDITSFWNSPVYRQFRKRLRRGDFYPACKKYCTFFLASKNIPNKTIFTKRLYPSLYRTIDS